MRKCLVFWQLASGLGCEGALNLPERKRIRLTNQSSIVLTLLIVVYAIVFGLFGPAPLGLITCAVASLFALIPVLHKVFPAAIWVRYLFLLSSYLSIFIYSLLVGAASGIHLFFISAIAAPFILLDMQRRLVIFVFCMIPLLLIFTLELILFESMPPPSFSPRAQRIIYLMMLPSVALTTFLYSGYFFLINQVSERELHATIQDLHRSHKLIGEQQLQLATASRLSAIGELSGSIAHEINNPLAIILGYTELIMKKVKADPLDRDRILQTCEKILKTISRIHKIVLGLRKLSREGQDDPLEWADLRDIIADATSICGESLAQLGIELRLTIPEGPCPCHCRPLQLSQVLLNLIHNAKDAVKNLDKRWMEIQVERRDPWLIILVRDSGVIRDADILARIGQPFFTTKPPGSGTGLGLSISRKILEAHGGSIELDRDAEFTSFVVKLPIPAQPRPRSAADQSP